MAPRTMLRQQLERLAAHGLTAFAATELDFILFRIPTRKPGKKPIAA